ncbi:MAG: heparinase II/III family protein, partial [Gemmatimonadota bacterium]
MARIPPWIRSRTTADAERIVGRRFDHCGHGPVALDPVDWDYAHLGDIAWTRDLNRHGAFESLGFAYHYTSDERFARTFVELADSWIAWNSHRIGRIEWDGPFEAARRINAWIWAYFMFMDWEGWSQSQRRSFLGTLGLLSEYLYQTLEYHSPGNHILLEAKSLAMCAHLFPEYVGAGRWGARAWDVLDREIKSQVCGDGVHAERSTMYHRIIAGELSELWLLCEAGALPRATRLREVVGRMAGFQRSIDLGRGCYPLLGDSRARDSYYRFSAPAIVAADEGARMELEDG